MRTSAFTSLMAVLAANSLVAFEWQQAPVPPLEGPVNQLHDITVISPTLAFASGYQNASTPSAYHGLILRWNGLSWTEVPNPVPGIIEAIDASSADDIYALSGKSLWHYDGSSWTDLWPQLPNYNSNPFFDPKIPKDIKVIGPDDVWLVGGTAATEPTEFGSQFLSIHYDGNSWTRVMMPAVTSGDFIFINTIEASGPNDIWAGSFTGIPKGNGTENPGIFHWDGSSWTRTSFIINGGGTTFHDLDVIAPDDVWATGTYGSAALGGDLPLYLHFDGTQWNHAAVSSTTGGKRNTIRGLGSEIWTGSFGEFTTGDGSSFVLASTPMTALGGSIRQIARLGSGLVAVGVDSSGHAIILHYGVPVLEIPTTTLQRNPGTEAFSLTLVSQVGFIYQLHSSSNLSDWSSEGLPSHPGNDLDLTFEIPPAHPDRFFRIQIEAAP